MDEQRAKEKWHERLSRVINSTACFSVAYILLTYLFWFGMGVAGLIARFDSFIYYYGIKIILNDQNWSKLKVSFIFFAGPGLCLGLGLLCLFLFNRLKKFNNAINIFLLWMFVIGTTMFTSETVVATLGTHHYASPYYKGFAVIFSWWHLPRPVVYLFALPLLFLFLFFCVKYAKPFVITAFSYSKVNTEGRRKRYFIETAIIPFILGAVVTSVVTYPMNLEIHAIYITMIALSMLIGWFSLTYIKVSKEELVRYEAMKTLNPFFLFLLLMAISLVFIGWKGINLHV
jgi:hypothetical protein